MLTQHSKRLASASMAIALAAFLPMQARAQDQVQTALRLMLPSQPISQTAVQQTAGPSDTQTRRVDESALYYYAQNNQHNRVEAEVRRLRTLHPQWTPPTDLYHGGSYNQDQALWDMFAAQEIAAIHDEIAARSAQEPGWQPPLELMQALERVETRRGLLADYEAGHTHTIVAKLEDEATLLDEGDLEVLWVAGLAYAKEQQRDVAVQIFDIAMRAVNTADELRGTLYNARDALPVGDVAGLLSTGRALHSNQTGYDGVYGQFALDLHRDRLGAELELWRVNTDRTHALSQDSIAAIEANWRGNADAYTTQADLAGDYELVGWAYYAQDNPTRALTLFQRALGSAHLLRAGTAARYGAALSMRDHGNPEGALELLAQGLPDPSVQSGHTLASFHPTPATNHEGDDRPMALYIELLSNALYGLEDTIALNPPRVARHSHYVGLLESAPGAEALGWYAYRSEQLTPAAAWFSKSLEWRPSPSAVEGLARSTWRMGEREDAQAHIARYSTRFAQLASLNTELEATQAAASTTARTASASTPTRTTNVEAASQAQRAGNPRRCLSLLQSAPSTHQVNLIRGWCLLDLGRSHEAAIAFEGVAISASATTRRDAGYGQALAMLRQGRTFDALAIARDTDLSEDQRAIVARSALADQANQAFNAGHYGDALTALDRRQRFAPEPRDLTLLRAWSLLRLNALNEARTLFVALDQQLSTRDTQRGLAALPQSLGAPLFGNR
ncbi:MAG: hypothetical protein AB8B88_08325 [Devosiaceae bacterium]